MPGIAAHRFAAACRNSRSWCAASANLWARSEEHTSELQSQSNIVCRLLLEKKQLRKRGEHLGHLHEQVVEVEGIAAQERIGIGLVNTANAFVPVIARRLRELARVHQLGLGL